MLRKNKIHLTIKDPLLDKNRLKIIKKDLLILGFEDRRLDRNWVEDLALNHDSYLGKSDIEKSIILIRDPYNLFASRLQRGYMNEKNSKEIIDLWKQYAKEFLGYTNFINDKICVNLNKWILDKSYRYNLANALDLDFDEKNILDFVSRYGGGSSFGDKDGTKIKKRINKRWEGFQNNELYRNIFKDEELVELSNSIFGKIV